MMDVNQIGDLVVQTMVLSSQIEALEAEVAELREQLPPKPTAPEKSKTNGMGAAATG